MDPSWDVVMLWDNDAGFFSAGLNHQREFSMARVFMGFSGTTGF